MRTGDDEQGLHTKNKLMVGGAVIAFVILGIIAAANYNTSPDGKVFGLQNFYEGVYGTEVDPRTQYNKLIKNVLADANKCLDSMTEASNPLATSSGYTWFVDKTTILTEEDLRAVAADEAMQELKPFTRDGQTIISPSELTFISSNTEQNQNAEISISAVMGDRYVIVFHNVKSWWCHIGKTEQNRHTAVVGKGGIYEKCVAGYVIGEAYKETAVRLYEIDDAGNRKAISFADIFINEEGVP